MYDDFASSVFHLFADFKRKLVGKNGIYTRTPAFGVTGRGGVRVIDKKTKNPRCTTLTVQHMGRVYQTVTTSVLDVLSMGSYRRPGTAPCVLRSDMTAVSLAQGRTL